MENTQKTLKEMRKQRINTLEDFVELGKVAVQEKGVIYLSESNDPYEGNASYRMFSDEPWLGQDFHADAYANKDILLGLIYRQEPRQLERIAHRMNPKEVLVSMPWMDRKGDLRVVKLVVKEPYFFMG